MGKSVLEFSRLHPDTSAGFITAAARLQDRLVRAGQLARQQIDGRSEVHAATARKRDLRRLMRSAHLDHLASVAQLASVDDPELTQKFLFPTDANSNLAFQTAASSMAAEAQTRKELLIKHGLSEEVLTALENTLEEFQTLVEQGAAGRMAHVGASAELVTVAEEVVQVVKVMNGLIRLRFANQPELLAAWESASNVVATPRPATPPTGTTPPSGAPPSTGTPSTSREVRPAA